MSLEIKGFKKFSDNLNKLPEKLRLGVLRKAMYKSSSVVIREIRNQIDATGINSRTGSLKKRIGSRVIYRKLEKRLVMIVGPIIMKGGTQEERQAKRTKLGILRDPFYSRYLEFGTEHLQGRHYMQKAFYATKEAWAEHFRQNVALGIEKEVQKLFNLNPKSR